MINSTFLVFFLFNLVSLILLCIGTNDELLIRMQKSGIYHKIIR
jgi:hypothetical protein